uniref:Uncharacterized protein n=1 Tax=Anopheles dirus TaxID=7168 RepID=A0A182NWK7_9DIPT
MLFDPEESISTWWLPTGELPACVEPRGTIRTASVMLISRTKYD